jgi:hypothetical protein
MPKYRITDPESGKRVTLTGDSPPTEAELEEVFATLAGKPTKPAGVPDPTKIPGWGAPVTPPPKPADILAAAPSADPGFLERNMPNTFGPRPKVQKALRDPDGTVTGYVPVEKPASPLDVAADLGTWEQRFWGAVAGKTEMNDPEGGIRKEARKEYQAWYNAHIDQLKQSLSEEEQKNLLNPKAWMVWYGVKGLQAGKLAAETGVALREAPVSAIATTFGKLVKAGVDLAEKGAKGLAKAGKSAVRGTSKLPGPALDRAAKDLDAVKAAAGAEEDLATQVADEVGAIRTQNRQALEAEQGADEAAYEAEVSRQQGAFDEGVRARAAEVDRRDRAHADATARQEATFEAETAAQKQGLAAGVARERPGAALPSPNAISPYESGKRLENAVAAARAAVGDKFGKDLSKAFHQSGISSQPLPQRVISESRGTKPGKVLGPDGQPIPVEVVKVTRQNPMEDFIDEALRGAGYDPKKGYQGNEAVSKAAVNWALERKAFAKNQRTLGQLLKFRRNFQDQLFKASDGPTPLFPRSGQGAGDYRFLKSVYDESNDLIAGLPAKYLGDQEGAAFRDAFRKLNADYSEVLGNLNDLAAGVGRAADPEDFMKKMKDIGVDNFKAFNQAAGKHPEMKQVVDEMRGMTFDNLIRLSLDPKNGNAFDAQRFVNLWNAEYRDNRVLLQEALGGERVARINQAVSKFKLPEKPAAIPRPEKPLDVARPVLPDKPEKIPAQEPAFPNLAGRQEQPNAKIARATLSNLGNAPNIFALRELEFLDNVLGLKGKDRFTERALNAQAAKDLGIGKDGFVPQQNLKHTGFAGGEKVAGTLTGAALGAWMDRMLLGGSGAGGATAGAMLGRSAGSYITSPSAAIALYKAFGKLEGVAVSKKAQSILKAAARTGSTESLLLLQAQLQRELEASGKVVPFRKVAEKDEKSEEQLTGDPEKPLRR